MNHCGAVRVSRGPALTFLLVSCLLAVAASLPFLAVDRGTLSRVAWVAEIEVDREGQAELFFDIGARFNARDAVGVLVRPAGESTTCRFPLPDVPVRQLRFDPTNAATRVDVRNPRLEDSRGRVLHRFTAGDFRPAQHVREVKPLADGFSVEIEPGQLDPILNVSLDASAHRALASRPEWARHVARWAVFFAALVLCGVLTQRAWPHLAGRIAGAMRRHPVAGLAATSAIAVAIQCHPVIFAGQSFVSPDIGAYLLYDGFPTLPGYQTETLEDVKSSDSGAIYYSHLYQPKIVRDALFRDGELPLWNRYTMGGVPALGQGQSMFGELLSIPVVLAGGEAWAWDLRFVLARWIYAFGAGLAVWLLTRHLLSATVVAATAVFIGFFAFRLNHPAQFSLTAAPWILVAWLALRAAGDPRQLVSRGALLAVANWQVHASGTVKEAAVLILCLNLAGLLLVLLDRAPWRLRLVRTGWAVFWGLVYALVTAPLWMVFLGSLGRAASVHGLAAVSQNKPWLFAGFFEDLLFRALSPGEPHAMATASLVVLCGLGWVVVRIGDAIADRGLLALALGFVATAAVAYGLVPASWILQVPLLANINHIGNSFSCALIVLGTVLAGGGIRILLARATGPAWGRECAWFAAFVFVLGWLYYGSVQPTAFSPFVRAYVPSLLLAVVVVHVVAGSRRLRERPGFVAVLLVASAAVLLWRHSTYVSMPFDAYVVNPKVRAAFRAPSPGVAWVDEHMSEPSRPNGIRYNLFSGFNAMLGWEGIYGADPLRNGHFDELAQAAGIRKLFWGLGEGDWSRWNEERAATLRPVLDALNVRYHLASPGTPAERMAGLTHRLSADFEIYESETAWPRAFFSSRLWRYASVQDLVGRLNTGPLGRPFAAVQSTDVALPGLPDGVVTDDTSAPWTTRPATDYRLTTNTTSFRVEADGPGVVVLTEGYFPDDVRASVNGRPVPVFRANHAFRAVGVPAAGTYEVRFEYWPKEMSTALILAAVGSLLALGALAWAWRSGRTNA